MFTVPPRTQSPEPHCIPPPYRDMAQLHVLPWTRSRPQPFALILGYKTRLNSASPLYRTRHSWTRSQQPYSVGQKWSSAVTTFRTAQTGHVQLRDL
ncbi:hypothetical protein EG68_11246 [Paragonimus skrjabini miyazakii]|uniref:Uncharacterized protein n=1 Tax=Paragonimus skrjabini miyazakii TaxID=59628 RepID=A0A8S9YQT6_9TREM|nr:hypothetical protein EG68_11246 [Paragonimus skrjabini miyazakii]